MRVLGIETATALCSVGLAGENGFEADYRLYRGNIHGEYLSRAVKEVVNGAGIQLKDIEGYAVSIGPGSFTGLRIGLGFVKGLVFGGDKPLAAVSTMDALMSRVPPLSEYGCVMITARKCEVYQGKYHFKGNSWEKCGEIELVEKDNIGRGFSDKRTIFIGNGTLKFSDIINKNVKRPLFIQQDFSLPSGYSIAKMGREMLLHGEIASVEDLVPFYLKRFQGIL